MDDAGLESGESGSWIEVGLQDVCCGLFWVFKVKVRRGITQCPPTKFDPLPYKSVALVGQYLYIYLNVRQRKLDTIIIQTVQ